MKKQKNSYLFRKKKSILFRNKEIKINSYLFRNKEIKINSYLFRNKEIKINSYLFKTEVETAIVKDWEKIHPVPERLASLGIIKGSP